MESAVTQIMQKLMKRLAQKGRFAYASSHETYGIIAEECAEFLDEVRANDVGNQQKELIDIAVGAIWGLASLKTLQENKIKNL